MTRSIRVLHLEDSPRDAEMIRHRLGVADVSCDIVLTNSKDEMAVGSGIDYPGSF